MTTIDIAEMPISEKLKLMEAPWASLSAQGNGDTNSPEWHGVALKQAEEDLAEGAAHFMVLSKGFPYAAYYRVEGDEIQVWRVLDCRRNSASIMERLKRDCLPSRQRRCSAFDSSDWRWHNGPTANLKSTKPRSQDMGYAELIERLRALPRDKQAEVFDFVEFLAVRSGAAAGEPLAQGEWTDSEFAGLAMTQALRGMDDDPVAYSAADLRERWQ